VFYLPFYHFSQWHAGCLLLLDNRFHKDTILVTLNKIAIGKLLKDNVIWYQKIPNLTMIGIAGQGFLFDERLNLRGNIETGSQCKPHSAKCDEMPGLTGNTRSSNVADC